MIAMCTIYIRSTLMNMLFYRGRVLYVVKWNISSKLCAVIAGSLLWLSFIFILMESNQVH